MMQGDAYKIPIEITMDGQPLTAPAEIEVMVGGIRKLMSTGEVTWSALDGAYMVEISQQETFRLPPASEVQVRVVLESGAVVGAKAGTLTVDRSQSKVVLSGG